MVDELKAIEQLNQVKRLLDNGSIDIAKAVVAMMIETNEARVAQFELEMEPQ